MLGKDYQVYILEIDTSKSMIVYQGTIFHVVTITFHLIIWDTQEYRLLATGWRLNVRMHTWGRRTVTGSSLYTWQNSTWKHGMLGPHLRISMYRYRMAWQSIWQHSTLICFHEPQRSVSRVAQLGKYSSQTFTFIHAKLYLWVFEQSLADVKKGNFLWEKSLIGMVWTFHKW